MIGIVLAVALSAAFVLTLLPGIRHARVVWDFVLLIAVLLLVLHVA